MAAADIPQDGWIARLGGWVQAYLTGLGDWVIFAGQTFGWTVRRRPARGTFVRCCYEVGVQSVGVVMITGLFIGMVLAVQSVGEFRSLGLESRLGTVINVSVVKELGPVLAATMLAGRVGGAMAAQLATMRISEQIDALACLGANPIHYLVVPRLLACVLMIPLLTAVADATGVAGGALITVHFYNVDAYQYWTHSRANVGAWEILVGLLKSVFFGAAIALISCHRGFRGRDGSEGVGRAATEAFVASFIAIDFLLAMVFNDLYAWLWPNAGSKMM